MEDENNHNGNVTTATVAVFFFGWIVTTLLVNDSSGIITAGFVAGLSLTIHIFREVFHVS